MPSKCARPDWAVNDLRLKKHLFAAHAVSKTDKSESALGGNIPNPNRLWNKDRLCLNLIQEEVSEISVGQNRSQLPECVVFTQQLDCTSGQKESAQLFPVPAGCMYRKVSQKILILQTSIPVIDFKNTLKTTGRSHCHCLSTLSSLSQWSIIPYTINVQLNPVAYCCVFCCSVLWSLKSKSKKMLLLSLSLRLSFTRSNKM